jgi:hypothetical protein
METEPEAETETAAEIATEAEQKQGGEAILSALSCIPY